MQIYDDIAVQLQALANIMKKVSGEGEGKEEADKDADELKYKDYKNMHREDEECPLPMRGTNIYPSEKTVKSNRKKGLIAIMISAKTKKGMDIKD